MRVGCEQQQDDPGMACASTRRHAMLQHSAGSMCIPGPGSAECTQVLGIESGLVMSGWREALPGLMRRWHLALLTPGNIQASRAVQSVFS